jgi:hypothetical protein
MDGRPVRPVEGVHSRPLGAVDRALPFLRRLAGVTLRLALMALAGGAALWLVMFREIPPETGPTVLAVAAVLLLLPPAILLLFVVAVRTLIQLPDRVRRLPGVARPRLAEIARHTGAAGTLRQRGALQRVRSLFQLGWAVARSREVLEVLGPATVLLRPWLLLPAAMAAVAAVVEVLAGLVAALWLALR